MALNAELYRAT